MSNITNVIYIDKDNNQSKNIHLIVDFLISRVFLFYYYIFVFLIKI